MIYCSVKYCCSNSSIPGVILHSIMKSIKTPNHPAYHWSTLWPLEVWVRGLYNSWWFCVHKLSMFIYLFIYDFISENSKVITQHIRQSLRLVWECPLPFYCSSQCCAYSSASVPLSAARTRLLLVPGLGSIKGPVPDNLDRNPLSKLLY